MTVLTYQPYSFNGTVIDGSGNISSRFSLDNGPHNTARMTSVEAAIPGLGDRDVRAQRVGSTWQIRVRLANSSEANVQTMLKVFSEEAGVTTLLITDSASTIWSVSARVLTVQQLPGTIDRFLVTVRVADPRWTENSATTNSQLNQTATPVSATLTNNGNRQARAAFTITADAAKTGVANDFGRQLQGFIVNRCPNDIVNKPVALFDVSGVQSRINTTGLCLASGDDIRVWLDDVPDIPRWLVLPNAAGTEVWINVSLPAASTYTLVAAMTAIAPANGASFTVNEDISRLAAKGFLVIGDEVFYYASKAGRALFGIQRAQWGSTAAIHILGANVWANPRHYVVATSFSGVVASAYGSPPAPLAQRPCFQLPESSNQSWRWGDTVADSQAIFFDRNYPDRTAQFVPGFDLDGNTTSPLMSLNGSINNIQFRDDVPGDGSPPVNFLEQSIPMGIKKSDVNAIIMDWNPNVEILNLELFTRDSSGTKKLQDQLQQTASALARTLPAALANTAYAFMLKARYNIAAGFRGKDAVGQGFTNPGINENGTEWGTFKLILERDTPIKAILVRLAKAAAGSQGMFGYVRKELSQPPKSSDQTPRTLLPTVTLSGTTPTFYLFVLPYKGIYKAGTYWVELAAHDGFAQWFIYGDSKGRQEQATARATNTDVWTWNADFTAWLYFINDYDNSYNAPINSDQPIIDPTTGLRTGTVVSFDKVIILIEPGQTIYVHRMGTFAQTMFHASGLLTNTTTGDSIQFDKWMALTSTLAVDCDARTVTYTEAGVAYPVTKAITPSNTADWMPLSPGANALTYVDAGLAAPGQLDFVSVFRGCKV